MYELKVYCLNYVSVLPFDKRKEGLILSECISRINQYLFLEYIRSFKYVFHISDKK